MKLGPADAAAGDLTEIQVQEIQKVLPSVIKAHVQKKVIPDLLVRILCAVFIIGLHQVRIALSQDAVMLFDQFFLLFAGEGSGSCVINECVVAQNMGIAQHTAAAAEIIFLSVAAPEGLRVEFSDELIGLLLHIHAESYRDGHSRIAAQRYPLHQICKSIRCIALRKRIVLQEDRN